MRVKKIKWKKSATLNQVRDAEAIMCELWDCDPFTYPKIYDTDTWVTYPRLTQRNG